jgi:hypothetical protein
MPNCCSKDYNCSRAWPIRQADGFDISVITVEFVPANFIAPEEMFRWFMRVFTREK